MVRDAMLGERIELRNESYPALLDGGDVPA